MKKSNYVVVDYFRIFAAILVVMIHIPPFKSFEIDGTIYTNIDFFISHVLARIAVPFFFIASGFFLFSGKTLDKKRTMRYLKKVLVLYVVWSILYIPFRLYDIGQTVGFTSETIRMLVKEVLFISSYNHLWYLNALFYATALILILTRFLKFKHVFILSVILFLLGLAGDSYYGIFKELPVFSGILKYLLKTFYTTRNGFMFGFMFMMIGGGISYQKSIKSMPFMFIISFILMIVETFILMRLEIARDYNMFIFLVPTSYFLFTWLISFKANEKNTISVRNMSFLIYVSHMLFLEIFRRVLTHNDWHLNKFYSPITLMVVLISTTIFSYSVIKGSQKRFLSGLDILY